jgi:hypothetical protein
LTPTATVLVAPGTSIVVYCPGAPAALLAVAALAVAGTSASADAVPAISNVAAMPRLRVMDG